MELNKKYFRLAMLNSAITAILMVTLLGLIQHSINGLTVPIILGYGLIDLLFLLPAYYISFKFHWNEGPVYSLRRFYFVLLSFILLTFPSLIYTSIAFGYNWKDYFVVNGEFNSDKVLPHLVAVFVPIFFVYIVQLLAITNEREIILNQSMMPLPKRFGQKKSVSAETTTEAQSADAAKDEEKASPITLVGNTRGNVLELDDIGHFFYAKSNANYLDVVYFDQVVKTKSLRMTIKQLEDTLSAYPQILRCHRAFVINVDNVSYFEGTASKGCVHFSILNPHCRECHCALYSLV